MKPILSLLIALALPAFAQWEIDWNKHLIDGIALSANYDTRYLAAEPAIDVSVDGVDDADALRLLDGEDPNRDSGVTWKADQDIGIDVDLRALRLVTGLCIDGGGHSSDWQFKTSHDSETWHEVTADKISELDAGHLVVGNLAAPARYIRITGVAGQGYYAAELWVFGELDPDVNAIGGVYPEFAPPVAGERTQLRAVIRNTSDEPLEDNVVRFSVGTGSVRIDEIPARTSLVVEQDWTPESTISHLVEVRLEAGNGELSSRRVSIPVVNRRLYFGSFYPLANHLVTHCNIYTTVGVERPTFEYLGHKIRGRMALAFCLGPHPMGEMSAAEYETAWREIIDAPFRDGIAMDEWSANTPEACEALAQVYHDRGDRKIVAWAIGGPSAPRADCFEAADLVFYELYLNMLGHDRYKGYLGPAIRDGRNLNVLHKSIIALGTFCAGKSSALEEIEREVRYIREHGPEIPGVTFYGMKWGPIDREIDALCDKYFIQPVITMDHDLKRTDDGVTVTIRNIGGMTARDVGLAVYAGDAELGDATIDELTPDESQTLTLDLPVSNTGVIVKIEPSDQYTALNLEHPPMLYLPRAPSGTTLTEHELSFRASPRGDWTARSSSVTGDHDVQTEIVGGGLYGKNFLRTKSLGYVNGILYWPVSIPIDDQPYQQLEVKFRLQAYATDGRESRILISPRSDATTFCYSLWARILDDQANVTLEYDTGDATLAAIEVAGGTELQLSSWYTLQVANDFRASTVQVRLGNGDGTRFSTWTVPISTSVGNVQHSEIRIALNGTVDIDAVSLQVPAGK